MAEDCDKGPKGGDVEKASSKTASPAAQLKSGAGGGASPNKAAKAGELLGMEGRKDGGYLSRNLSPDPEMERRVHLFVEEGDLRVGSL